MKLIFVIGATNAGKSTLIQAAQAMNYGTVEVGKMLRAKYPPEYFEGKAALEKTETEAWSMMLSGIQDAAAEGKTLVFIDGQPRTLRQFKTTCALATSNPVGFLHLWAPVELRRERAVARDQHDPAKLALSLSRLQGDLPALYDIVVGIHSMGFPHDIFDTTSDYYTAYLAISQMISKV